MGIVESRVVAHDLLSACEKAEKEGKNELDECQFWNNAETIKASKAIYKYIPNKIRRSRQPAIRKAISHSSQQLQVPQIVQDLQDRRESLFSSHASQNEDAGVALQIAVLPQNSLNSTPISPLNSLYKLIVVCEKQQHLEKIRIRILCVAIFRLKDAIQSGTCYQYDDASIFIAHVIRNSGSEDPLSVIERRVRLWVSRGERYNLIARDLGGLGVLYMLPDDGGESMWTKELPKTAKPNRIAMMGHLSRLGLPKEAESRGLHEIAENEVSRVFNPAKAMLDQIMENQLSNSNVQRPIEDERPGETQNIWSSINFPRPRHSVIGLSEAVIPHHDTSHLELLNPIMHGNEAPSHLSRTMVQQSHEGLVVKTPTQPGHVIMPHGQPGTIETRHLPTEPTEYETDRPHYPQMENEALFSMEQNGLEHFSNATSPMRNTIATITPADFPQAFAVSCTSIPAEYPQIFPYGRQTVTPADYPLVFPYSTSQYPGCADSQSVMQPL